MAFNFPQFPNVPQIVNLGDLPQVIPQVIPQEIPIQPQLPQLPQVIQHKKSLMNLTKENLKIITSNQSNEHKFKEIFKNFNIKFVSIEIDIDLIKSSFNLINHLIELKQNYISLFVVLKLLIIKLINSDLNGMVAYAANDAFNKMVVDDLVENIKEQKDIIKNKCDHDFKEATNQLKNSNTFNQRQQLNHIKAKTTLLIKFVDSLNDSDDVDLLNDLKTIFYCLECMDCDFLNNLIDSFLFGYFDPFNDLSDIEAIAEGLEDHLNDSDEKQKDEETEEIENMLSYFKDDFKYDFKRLIESGYTPEEVTNELNLNHMYEMIDYYFESIDDDLLKEFERLLNNVRFGVLSSLYKIEMV